MGKEAKTTTVGPAVIGLIALVILAGCGEASSLPAEPAAKIEPTAGSQVQEPPPPPPVDPLVPFCITCDDADPAWSPDGTQLVFSTVMGGSIASGARAMALFVLDMASGEYRQLTTSTNALDIEPDWSPDGSQIVFTSSWDTGDIVVVNADGSNRRTFVADSSDDFSPHWSPDGTKIAFVSDRDKPDGGDIYTLDIATGEILRLTSEGQNNLWPSWSPSGARIAFASDRDGDFELYVMNADGSDQSRLTGNSWFDGHPTWSPDGRSLAFASVGLNLAGSGQAEAARIFVMEIGGVPRPVTRYGGGQDTGWPAWSPDGSRIAYVSTFGGDWNIYSVKTDGSHQISLTAPRDFEPLQVTWSATGELAFVSARDGNDEIYVLDSDRESVRRLTTTPWNENSIAWSPDGTRLAFSSDRSPSLAQEPIDSIDFQSYDLYTMNPNGRDIRLVAATEYDDFSATWSPDGRRIAFTSDGILWLVDTANGSLTDPITETFMRRVHRPAWSPNGRAIAFHTTPPFQDNHQIFLYDTVEATVRQISRNPERLYQWAEWHPDGNTIVVQSDPDDLFMIALAGQGVDLIRDSYTIDGVTVGSDQLRDYQPVWSPDGSSLAVVTRWRPEGPDGYEELDIHIIGPDGVRTPLDLHQYAEESWNQ